MTRVRMIRAVHCDGVRVVIYCDVYALSYSHFYADGSSTATGEIIYYQFHFT